VSQQPSGDGGLSVGWVGLGAMGAPMAACAARAGHRVVAYDIDATRAPALAGDGVAAAASVAEVADHADILAVMVATPDQATDVLFGPDGGGDAAAPALRSGAVVLVLATVGPAAVESWADRLTVRGVDLVDAPVSGGVARAATGDLLVMVSGADPGVERVRPLLDALASNAPVVGATPGTGQKVKLVNQLLCGVHIAAAAEALAFAEALGLDAKETREVIRHGAAASFMLDDRGERMVTGAFDDVRSALDIFVKDMGLVTGAATEAGYSAPLATTAERLYRAGHDAGLGRRDDSTLVELMRGRIVSR
jgi:3-hydroxyisobutyrate dehydrogenase